MANRNRTQLYVDKELKQVVIDFQRQLNKKMPFKNFSQVDASKYIAQLVKRSKIIFIRKKRKKLVVNFENAMW